MELIKSVRIQGFRSIAEATLGTLGEHTTLVGKNSSGKSNILRALSVFFNGESSPGVPLDFDRDLHYRPTRKQKKRISVSIDFCLPDKFNFRPGVEHLKKLGANFTIEKTWELDRLRQTDVKALVYAGGVRQENSEQLARDFLSLVVFRYIPNRTVPAELLRDESQAVASAIFRKLKDAEKAADVLKGLSESAGKLLNSTAVALKLAGAPISEPNIATANSLGEMLSMSGFQARGLNGATVRDEDWGAGHQAFFLLGVLREIDTDYSRQFGWRQACIWAVEEPESGLHHELQTRLAQHLMEWTSDVKRRLQLITTTHSPIVAMSADQGFWVEIASSTTEISQTEVVELVRAAEDRGVTSYIHPVLSFPFHPVVLVEGYIDEKILNHVARMAGRGQLKFISLPKMDEAEEAGGIDSIITYVKRNRELIARRQPEAPLIVLADWEVPSDKMSRLRKAYGEGGDRLVVVQDVQHANPKLGKSFRGIERFYCADVVREIHEAGHMTVAFPPSAAGPAAQWSVTGDELVRGKSRLLARMLEIQDVNRLRYLVSIVEVVYAASVAKANEQLGLIGMA